MFISDDGFFLTSTQTTALFTFVFDEVICFTRIARFIDKIFAVRQLVVAERCW